MLNEKTNESDRHRGLLNNPSDFIEGGHGHIPIAQTPLGTVLLQPVISSAASNELYFHYRKKQSERQRDGLKAPSPVL